MRTIQLGRTGLQVPVMAVGCMRISKLDKREASASFRRRWRSAPTSSTTRTCMATAFARRSSRKRCT